MEGDILDDKHEFMEHVVTVSHTCEKFNHKMREDYLNKLEENNTLSKSLE